MVDLQQRYPHEHYCLAGYSLGGNFTLRTTIAQAQHNYRIDRSVAVCPVICPNDTMTTLGSGLSFYEKYFVKKWKSSLLKKTKHYPQYTYEKALKKIKTLSGMNKFFIPGNTPFDDSHTYFEAYHLKNNRLAEIATPTTIIMSEDDPIVRHQMLPRDKHNEHLSLEITKHGSHCAFLKNYHMDSWIDDRLIELFR